MSFQDAVRVCLTEKYATWQGRAGRAEYWYFALFNFVASAVAGIVDQVIGTIIVQLLVGLALLVPGICVGIRRLHDTNRSGWWMLIGLVPLVGWIVLIIFFVTRGDDGANQYGPPPAERTVAGMPPAGMQTP